MIHDFMIPTDGGKPEVIALTLHDAKNRIMHRRPSKVAGVWTVTIAGKVYPLAERIACGGLMKYRFSLGDAQQ